MNHSCVTTPTADSEVAAADELPSWLSLPPTGDVLPPVVSRAQTLPLSALTWENFERLCVRLALLEADIEHCQLYGVRGQDQHGIDLYGRLRAPIGAFAAYQCKNVRAFGATDLKSAVDTFLEGRWATSATRFVVCTTASLVGTSSADALEVQTTRLRERGIALIPWDSEAISLRLKSIALGAFLHHQRLGLPLPGSR